jgi:hypothetical protein
MIPILVGGGPAAAAAGAGVWEFARTAKLRTKAGKTANFLFKLQTPNFENNIKTGSCA